jgi:hypothetical protein
MIKMLKIMMLAMVCLLIVPALSGCTNEVYSVLAGYPVTYSSRHSAHECSIFRLDIQDYAFSAGVSDKQQWVQTTSMNPELCLGVVTQGRSNNDQWITEYMVSYSNDGREWTFVDKGRLFKANTDRNTWVRNNFDQPVFARAIRIHPTGWVNYISFRFDIIFQSH